MPRVAVPIVLSLLAAALGGVAGALTLALQDSAPLPDGGHRGGVATEIGISTSPDADSAPSVPGRGETSPGPPAAWSARLSSDDEDVRHAAALELLRRGPDAWGQARALRPTTAAGRELQGRLSAALRKIALVRRGHDYAKLPDYVRERLDLDEARAVVPERLLVAERLRVWRAELEAARRRLDAGTAQPGEVALAQLELLHARRDGGELDVEEHRQLAPLLLATVEGWLAELESEPHVAPARIRQLREQVSRLRP